MTKLYLILLLFLPVLGFANDGAYYASGNQLIPIFETDISVQKEILTIKKRNRDFIEVTVYYEFFNPKETKEILVGFEAFSPSGDVNPTPRNGKHPYMQNFTVQMNGAILPYEIAYVSDSIVTDKGKLKSLDLRTISTSDDYSDEFYYVYHFKGKFKKGLNKITHTYTYKVSGSVSEYFDFDYVLTAANSWANKQIDDFTLVLDLGECEEFNIGKTFFDEPNEWLVNGIGKVSNVEKSDFDYRDYSFVNCVVQKGNLIFQKKNFKPKDELFVWLTRRFYSDDDGDSYYPGLNLSYYYFDGFPDVDNKPVSLAIKRNLPYARRGYVFKNAAIQNYYLEQSWYIPNPYYEAEVETLHPIEVEWLRGLGEKLFPF